MRIRRLEPSDDRARFRSGNDDLDRFFRRYAGQNQFRHHIGVTYVATENSPDDGESESDEADAASMADMAILGFVTVSPSQLEADVATGSLGRRLPPYPAPVLRVARLAVAETRQGRGVGLALLKHAFELARAMGRDLGCIGVVVDAKPHAQAFYARLGFRDLHGVVEGELGDRPAPKPMFLALGDLPAAR